MDKLAGYGSDDDYDDSPKHRKGESTSTTGYDYYSRNNQNKQQLSARQVDVNYEEVQMDLSEDSNNSDSSSKSRDTFSSKRDRASSKPRKGDDGTEKYKRKDDRRDDRDSPKYYSKSRRDDEEDRYKRKDDRRDDRDRYTNRNRDEKYSRDKYRDDRSKSYRSNRSSSKERRSRSPRKPEFRGKRSSSRDRDVKAAYQRKFERSAPKLEQEKIVEVAKPVEPPPPKQETDNKDRFYMPGITGRFKEQIERRKLLWQKKEPERKQPTATSTTTAGKVWQTTTTTFAQDTDGKVASKFKRLMGIKESNDGPKGTTDTLKKQEEMFSSMEQQYEVARTATHTMRGVGLGFGSFQR
ncbi:hypothetical protein AMK59_7692 [Oryctes borbonicus]|uniref:Small acidic protein-like domain-containing protein n=1 Tax=Oryctes borbonicus TaxID=1629725 RepID=A0A0T6AUY7_9SCAR|nr:hypothetical protein AMK59_7692 [Oryctes borbonicus]